MINLEKKVSLYFMLVIVFTLMLGTVFFGASIVHVMNGGERLGTFGEILLQVAKFPSQAKSTLLKLKGGQLINISNGKFSDLDGFYKNGRLPNKIKEDNGYLLVSSYDAKRAQSITELIKINTQKVIKEWVPNIEKLRQLDTVLEEYSKPPEITNFRLYNPILLSNGGLVFNNGGGAFGVDICSNTNFYLDGTYHHSNEIDNEENIWIPSVKYPHSFDNLPPFRDDAVTKISKSGKILFKKSVAKILIENGYRGLFAVGDDIDPIHLNDIQPALTSSKYWNKGDLLLSLRQRSTVLLYRPSTNKVIWLQTGPWMNQHDANFVGDHEISVFGNNVIDVAKKRVLFDGYNNVYRYNLENNSITRPYDKIMKKAGVRTITSGRGKILTNGDAFVEETNNGRLLRLGKNKVKWEYAKKINKDNRSLLSWSRYLTEEEVSPILNLLNKTSCKNN